MGGQGRLRGSVSARRIAVWTLVVWAATVSPSDMVAAADDPSNPLIAAAREDAELADVFFLDRHRGWAVGDRGVIWHTSDGGRELGASALAD